MKEKLVGKSVDVSFDNRKLNVKVTREMIEDLRANTGMHIFSDDDIKEAFRLIELEKRKDKIKKIQKRING